METIKIDFNDPAAQAVKRMAEVIGQGGLVIAPTCTVYAIFADALNRKAVEKVLKLKRRSRAKGFILTLCPRKEIFKYVRPSPLIPGLLRKFPGENLSFVLPRKKALPGFLSPGSGTAAFHFFFSALDRKFFRLWRTPLIGTSANISNLPAADSCRRVLGQFRRAGAGAMPDLVLDAGRLPPKKPSALIELKGKEFRVLRP